MTKWFLLLITIIKNEKIREHYARTLYIVNQHMESHLVKRNMSVNNQINLKPSMVWLSGVVKLPKPG